jgi:hypothetical protein
MKMFDPWLSGQDPVYFIVNRGASYKLRLKKIQLNKMSSVHIPILDIEKVYQNQQAEEDASGASNSKLYSPKLDKQAVTPIRDNKSSIQENGHSTKVNLGEESVASTTDDSLYSESFKICNSTDSISSFDAKKENGTPDPHIKKNEEKRTRSIGNSSSPVKTTPKSETKKLDYYAAGNIPIKRSWRNRSASFASTSPRFPEPKVISVPIYNPPTIDRVPSSPNASFKFTSPRFPSRKSTTPPPTAYQSYLNSLPNDKDAGTSAAAFRFTSKRFSEKPSTTPGPTLTHGSFVTPTRSSSPFGSTSKRFTDIKTHSPPSTAYSPQSTFKISTIASASFRSTSPRLSTSRYSPIKGPGYIEAPSSFQKAKESFTPFASSSERFKNREDKLPGPGMYYVPELPESLYIPSKRN